MAELMPILAHERQRIPGYICRGGHNAPVNKILPCGELSAFIVSTIYQFERLAVEGKNSNVQAVNPL